jgi:hypothetical protein
MSWAIGVGWFGGGGRGLRENKREVDGRGDGGVLFHEIDVCRYVHAVQFGAWTPSTVSYPRPILFNAVESCHP